jgi:hypothetical protein
LLAFAKSTSSLLGVKLTKQQQVLSGILLIAGAALGVDTLLLDSSGQAGPSVASGQSPPSSAQAPADSPPAQVKQARVASAPSSSAGSRASALPDSGLTVELQPTSSLTERLSALQSRVDVNNESGNAFIAPASWVTPSGGEDEPAGGDGRSSGGARPEIGRQEASAFRLGMIIVPTSGTTQVPIAAINGKAIAVGTTMLGYTLVEASERGVVLARGDHRIELKVPRRTPMDLSENQTASPD